MENPTFAPLPEHIVAQLNAVSTATISYQLAARGFGNTFMAGLAPLRPDLRLCGRAVTLRYIPVRADLLKQKNDETNAQRQLIESIGAGEVMVIDARGTMASASIGNILSTRVQARGAAGIVTDGCFRDYPAIQAMDFPTYARGRHAAVNSTALLPIDINLPIGCGGVAVVPGDVIVGDAEGVIVIPYDIVEEVAADAAEQEQVEDYILQKIRGGASSIGLYPPNDNVRAEFRRHSK
ncbi:MAG: ribonuclease activity regulator RraA [Acidobacteria bacterium]|nr:ribonuclease activity regulator RraA [Acidobacteriota bacterium]MBI3425486.1 ribonuclease activity regulator RraA [Acidobacteriota bacterium]